MPSDCSNDSAQDCSQCSGCRGAADLRMRVVESLQANPNFHGQLRGIQVESEGDTLVLKGAVASYYMKQLLQESLRHVEGLARIENHVKVVKSDGLLSID